MGSEQAADMDLGLEVVKGFVGKIVQAAFGFAGAILFARVLGPSGFGGFYLLLSLVEVSKRPVSGISSAIQKRYAEVDAARQELIGVQVVVSLLALVIVSVGVLILSPFLVSYTDLESAPLLFVLLFAAVANFPAYQNLLTAIGRLGAQTWIDTLRSVLTSVGQLLFVLAGYGAAGMAFGLTLGTVLLFPVTYYYLRTLPVVPSRGAFRSVWSFGKYSTPSVVVGKAYDRFDILLLGVLATPAVAGQYEVAFKLTVPAAFISGLSGSGLMAKVSDLDSRDEAVAEDISNTLAFSSLFSIPLFFGALAIPQTTIVTLYGPEYSSAAALLTVLTLYRVVNTQTNVFGSIVNGLNAPQYLLRASTVALLVNVPLGVVLFFEMGPVGVVIATVVAEIVRYGMLYVPIQRRIDATLIPRALLEQALSGGVMFLVVDATRGAVAMQSWVEFGALVILGVVLYFTLLFIISRHFRVTLCSVIKQAYDGNGLSKS